MAIIFESVLLKIKILLYGFCGQKDSVLRIFIKKCFMLMVRSVCHVKQFNLGGKRFADDRLKWSCESG
jgi:hypothetical protein